MDKYRHIWRGQLLVGKRDIGQATIWTTHNSYLPPIGWKLKMTYITEYSDLWNKVLEAEPTLLSRDTFTKINNKYVSLFTITASTPEFLQLTKDLVGANKTRIMQATILKDKVQISLIPPSKETQRLGLWMPPKEHYPFLYMVLISKSSPGKDMQKHKKKYLQVMSKMGMTSTPNSGRTNPDSGQQKTQGNRRTEDFKYSLNAEMTLLSKEKKGEKSSHSLISDHQMSRDREHDRESRKLNERKREEKLKDFKEKGEDVERNGRDKNKEDKRRRENAEKHKVREKTEISVMKTDKKSHVHEPQHPDQEDNSYLQERKSKIHHDDHKIQKSGKILKKYDNKSCGSNIRDVMEKIKKVEERSSKKSVNSMESIFRAYVKVEKLNIMPGNPGSPIIKKEKAHNTEKMLSKDSPKSAKNSSKKMFLDTKKLKTVFNTNAKQRPDLIKPSMLKRSIKESMEHSLKLATPDLIAYTTQNLPNTIVTEEKAIPNPEAKENDLHGATTEEDNQERKSSVRSVLKTTLKTLVSTPNMESTHIKEETDINSDQFRKALSSITPKSIDSGCVNTITLDSTMKSQEEILKIPEETRVEQEVPNSLLSRGSLVTSSLSPNYQQSDMELKIDKEKNLIKYRCELETNSKRNALDTFKEFIVSKFGNKRKSDGTERALQELQSPSKKFRGGSPLEHDIMKTPQTSCYPDIFRNIKHRYRKSINNRDLVVEKYQDENTEKLKSDGPDSACSQLEVLDLSVCQTGDSFSQLEKGAESDKTNPCMQIKDNMYESEEMEPLNLSVEDSITLQSLKDLTNTLIKAEDCSLDETVFWKSPDQSEIEIPFTQEGKQYLMDMFLQSMQQDATASQFNVIPMDIQEDSVAADIVDKDPKKTLLLEQSLKQKNSSHSDKILNVHGNCHLESTFIVPKKEVNPQAISNLLPPHIQDVSFDDIVKLQSLVISDQTEACFQRSQPQLDGISEQTFLSEGPANQTPFELLTDDQIINSSQPYGSSILSASKSPLPSRFIPNTDHRFSHAVAQSSPKLVSDEVKKGKLQNEIPVSHLLPSLPPLQRLSDLKASALKLPLPLIESEYLCNQAESTEPSGDVLDLSIGSLRYEGSSEQDLYTSSINNQVINPLCDDHMASDPENGDTKAVAECVAPLSIPSEAHTLEDAHVRLQKPHPFCVRSDVIKKSANEESHVLQQLKKRIELWQNSGDIQSSVPMIQGITALSAFIKHPTISPSTGTSSNDATDCSKHLKVAMLNRLLHQNERSQQLQQAPPAKIIAVKCKGNCGINTGCSPRTCYMMKDSSQDESDKLSEEKEKIVIESKMTLIDVHEPEVDSWDSGGIGISKDEFRSAKYLHLFNASESDVLKMKYFCRAHQMIYASKDNLVADGGYILIQHSAVDDFISAPSFLDWCHQPNIKFGVYTSLSALLNNKVSPVLTCKWLLLLHHTAMVDPQLGRVLMRVLDNMKLECPNQCQIVVPLLTLKICYCCIVNSTKVDKWDRQTCRILQKNIILLIKCLGNGVAKIISGDCSWGSLGPESSIHEHLQCLKILHHNYRLIHREALLLVGDCVKEEQIKEVYYKVMTVGKLTKIMDCNE